MIEPATYVIFGATGNLATTKLLPSLYHLDRAGRLDPGVHLLCCGRRPYDRDQWLAQIEPQLRRRARSGVDETVLQRFVERIGYFQGNLHEPEMYARLAERVTDESCSSNIAFYMSISPNQYGEVVERLSPATRPRDAAVYRRARCHSYTRATPPSAGTAYCSASPATTSGRWTAGWTRWPRPWRIWTRDEPRPLPRPRVCRSVRCP